MYSKILAGSLVSLFATSALAAEVQWNFNNRAVAVGTACKSMGADADTFFINAGNEFSVVFSRMGVSLGTEYGPNAERQNCTVRVPVRISKGMYIGELTQTLLYGVTKSARTSGEISARATFFNLPAASIRVPLPYGRFMDDSLRTVSVKSDYRVNAPTWCSRPGLEGMYAVNLATAGQRDAPNESIVMQIDGADLKFQAVAGFYYCNL
jgi:hypothetical protein